MAKSKKSINRIKVVLAEKERTNKWLSEKLSVTPNSVSKWCLNLSQPSLEKLVDIADALDVDILELLNSTKNK